MDPEQLIRQLARLDQIHAAAREWLRNVELEHLRDKSQLIALVALFAAGLK